MDLNTILNLITGTDPSTVLTFLGLGGITSVVTQYIKHKLDLQKERVIITITIIFALIAVGVQYFLFAANQNPNLIGQHTAVVVFVSTLVYYFAVKPFYTTLQNSKAYKASQASQNVLEGADKLIEATPTIEPAIEKAVAEAPAVVASTTAQVTNTITAVKANVAPTEFEG